MTLDELTRPLTPEQAEAALYGAMVAQGLTTTSWKPGAVVRTIVTALAIVVSAVTELVALVARSGFLEHASGPWLDLVARYVYDTERAREAFATGAVVLTNDSGVGAFLAVPAGDLVVKNAAGKTYRSTAVFSLPAVPGATVTVPIQADEAGAASSTAAATITQFVTTFVGCSVTNPAALVGSDRELDEALRARSRAKTGVLSPHGPRDAYAYVATSARRADGTSIGVTRVRCIADGIGGVDVYLADADGAVTGTAGDLATDLGIIDRAIQEHAAPLAITARPQSATPHVVDVAYELWIDTAVGLSDAEIISRVEGALVAYLASVPIGGETIPGVTGGHVYRSAIQAAITAALPRRPIRLALTAPAADVSLAATAAPLAGVVTPTAVHQVSSLGVI